MNNKEIVKYFYEVIATKNVLDEVARYVITEKVEDMCSHLASVRNTYPDYAIRVVRQFEDGEYVISEIIMRGTHCGEFLGITPTNNVIEITGINIDRVVKGKIAEHSGAANTLEALVPVFEQPNKESLEAIKQTENMIRTGSGNSFANGHDLIEAALDE